MSRYAASLKSKAVPDLPKLTTKPGVSFWMSSESSLFSVLKIFDEYLCVKEESKLTETASPT